MKRKCFNVCIELNIVKTFGQKNVVKNLCQNKKGVKTIPQNNNLKTQILFNCHLLLYKHLQIN